MTRGGSDLGENHAYNGSKSCKLEVETRGVGQHQEDEGTAECDS